VFGFSSPKNATSMSILWGRTFFISLKYKLWNWLVIPYQLLCF
jgi:hypothetical protein